MVFHFEMVVNVCISKVLRLFLIDVKWVVNLSIMVMSHEWRECFAALGLD